MFSKIIAWFRGVEHDVEAIIGDFTNTVAKLEAAAVAKMKEAEEHTAEALRYNALASEAGEASERATAVAQKIKDLIA